MESFNRVLTGEFNRYLDIGGVHRGPGYLEDIVQDCGNNSSGLESRASALLAWSYDLLLLVFSFVRDVAPRDRALCRFQQFRHNPHNNRFQVANPLSI